MKLSTDCQPIVMHTLRIVIIGRLVFAFLTSNPTIFRVPHFKSDHFAGFGGFSQLTAGFWWVFAAYGWVLVGFRCLRLGFQRSSWLATSTSFKMNMRSLNGWQPAQPGEGTCVRLMAGKLELLPHELRIAQCLPMICPWSAHGRPYIYRWAL